MDAIVTIKYESGCMKIHLPTLFGCRDKFSRSKKIIKLSLVSDWYFHTNNYDIWNCYIAEQLAECEMGLSHNKKLAELAIPVGLHDKSINRRIHSLEKEIMQLQALLNILNCQKSIEPKKLF